jgi:site-specific DNA-methyltransferase (adenine-specific)
MNYLIQKLYLFDMEYFEQDNIRLLLGDNLELMREIPTGYFNIGLVDPPYGISAPTMAATKFQRKKGAKSLNDGGRKSKNQSDIDWDSAIPDQEYFDELFRITKNQIIWGGNYFPFPPTRCYVCWDKVQPWENFSQIELAWTSFDTPSQLFRFDNRTGGKIHPTQKPVELYSYLIRKYCKEGDKIFDSHLGSGTIAHAVDTANKLDHMKLDFTGIEIGENNFRKAVDHFKNYSKQPFFNFPE